MVMGAGGRDWIARIGRRLSLRELHILLVVADRGSMAKAAAYLSVSQPAVSKAIADLEQVLGVRLVERSRAGITPTAYGAALIQRGRAVFAELREGLLELDALADPRAGVIRMGCAESMAAGLLPAAIDRFLQTSPGATIHVEQAQTITLEFTELRERRVDLMLGRISRRFSEPDLSALLLFEEELHVVAGIQSRWARRRKVRLADLMEERWILTPSDNVIGEVVQQAFRSEGLPVPRPAVESLSFHLRNHLLASGDYLSVIPGSMLRFFNARRAQLKALRLDVSMPAQPVAVITLRNHSPAPGVARFIECLVSTAASMPH